MERLLEVHDELPLPIERVFEFFSDAMNLERITPPELRFEIVTPQPIRMQQGRLIDYRLRLFGVPFTWQSHITEWNPPHAFTDEQTHGPYGLWIHRHTFESTEHGTRIHDRVRYRLPFYPFGEIALPMVRRQLQRIFAHRQKVIRELLLGEGDSSAAQPPTL